METRANNLLVGAVTLVLLALLAVFIIWMAGLNKGEQKLYDIFFKQSVDGLAKGTAVAYSGVPDGEIKSIQLWKRDPSFVRVRIAVNDNVPILVGTTATIQSSFTGVGNIQLSGGIKGNPPITQPGPEGVPIIPTKRSGLGALLTSAPELLEKLSTLTDKLNRLLSDKNQKSIQDILAHTDKMTGDLAEASPQVKQVLSDLQVTLAQASVTLDKFGQVADRANGLLSSQGNSLATQLHDTLKSAQGAADELKAALSDTRPAMRQLSQTTLPAAEAAIRELGETSRSLRRITDKINEQGAGAVISGQKLPDYKP
jgi:phospholipid/cholesterol/gamma-HCH transport system substrate-binding protein